MNNSLRDTIVFLTLYLIGFCFLATALIFEIYCFGSGMFAVIFCIQYLGMMVIVFVLSNCLRD